MKTKDYKKAAEKLNLLAHELRMGYDPQYAIFHAVGVKFALAIEEAIWGATLSMRLLKSEPILFLGQDLPPSEFIYTEEYHKEFTKLFSKKL